MKKKILIALITLFFALFLLIGKIDISSIILKPALNELQEMLGMEVSIDKAYLHLIPLYIEFKNIVISNPEKNTLMFTKAKLYVGLTRILNKEIEIRRVALYSGNLSLTRETLNKCIESVSVYLKKPTKFPLKLKFNSFEIEKFNGSVYDKDLKLNLKELYGRVVLRAEPKISIFSNVKLSLPKYPNIDTQLKASFKITEREIILEELKLFDINSLLKSSGRITHTNFLGEFIVSGKIFLKSLMKIFGLKDGYGEINIDGKVSLVEAQKWQDKIKMNLKFDASFLLEELMKILKVSETLTGVTEAKGEVEGCLSDPQVNARVSLKKGNILGVKVDTVEAEAVYKNGILEFKNGKVKLYGGSAQAHVWITLPKVIKHYVFIELNNVSSSGIFELLHWNPGIAEGTVKGWLISEGEKFSPQGSFVYLRKGHKPDDLRGKIEWIKGVFKSARDVYKFTSLEIALSKSQVKANGYIDTKNNNLNFAFTGSSEDINELLIPYQKGIYGNLNFIGKLSGTAENPEISINFISKKISILTKEIENSLPEQTFTFDNLKGNIVYGKNLLLINELTGKDILFKGKILFPQAKNLFELKNPVYDLFFSIKNLYIKNLYVKALNKEIQTFLNLEGSIKDRGKITANLICSPLFLGNHKIINKIAGLISFEKEVVFIKNLNIFNNGNVLTASGYLNLNGEISISAISKTFDITDIAQNYAKKIGMKYIEKINLNKLSFQISGSIRNPVIDANTTVTTKLKNGKNMDGIISLNYKQNYLIMKAELMKNIFFSIEGLPDKKQWNITGNFVSARIDPVAAAFVNNLPEDLVILVNGKLKGSLVDKNFDAQIDLNRVFTRLYGIGLNNKNPVSIRIQKGNVYFTPLTFLGQSTELTIKGKIVDYFDILIEGSSDLKPFKALFKVDDIRGRASMQVYIYESRQNPEIVGEVDINNASITLRKDIPSLSNINATLSFNEDRVIIEKAYGTFSEGSIEMEGTVYLEKFGIKQLAVSGKFSSVRWIFAPKCWAYLDGQVYLTGAYSQPLLSGQINIQKGVYTERIDWTRLALKSSSSKLTVAKDSWFNNLRFNLRAKTSNFFVNNNLATVNLNSDLLLRGSLQEPSLIGWINAKEGWIYFRGSKFEIMQALIQFNDPNSIRPYLNVSARTNVSQYNINLNLNGYIDQFNLILSSNPPLSESELLNLLVLGQNGGGKGIPGASEAASFITGQMHELLEERVRGLTGLDVMTVEPGVSKTTGSIAPRITVGKKLMDGRLTVTYSTQAGATAEQIIKVEYLVRKGVSLVGTKDEIGGISGAIKFRFEFR
ncbi:translocation/assembly module TamB domain-containing protein [Thermodesulfovibrio sp. 3907-1M]|uniref:Translocation/assembly module TamB domain-containing protein n=1 Tax=Thermodesulfovibrio autotrophicus TaxID=3118333 RepID=A0AAU8GYG0_9BACT